MSEVRIVVIHAENCKDCAAAEATIEKAIEEAKIPAVIMKKLFEDPGAVKMAIKHGISTLPSAIVFPGGTVFQKGEFDFNKLVEAIKKAGE